VKPMVHLFGHIHEGYGTDIDDNILFVNAANVDRNKPIVIDIKVPA